METNSNAFKRLHGIPLNQSLSLSEIASLSGMPIKALQEVFDKGVGAYHTNPTSVRPSVNSPEQWAFGRVYSFVMKQPTTFGKADKHIADAYNLSGSGQPRYVITPHTKAQAKQAGLEVKPSTRKGKKLDVYDLRAGEEPLYLASIGATDYGDYGTYLKEEGKEVADERRRLYHIRHRKNTGVAGRLASFLLW